MAAMLTTMNRNKSSDIKYFKNQDKNDKLGWQHIALAFICGDQNDRTRKKNNWVVNGNDSGN